MTSNKNQSSPPEGASFWELFDFFWARGLGNDLHEDGSPMPWTAVALERAFDGTPDKRSIENWQSRANMPSPDNIRRLSWVISGGDVGLRKQWYDALIAARLEEKRKDRHGAHAPGEATATKEPTVRSVASARRSRWLPLAAAILGIVALAVGWFFVSVGSPSTVENIRICDRHYFDTDAKDCTQHVSVFVHGVDEVFLSFDFNDVPDGTPFERWWIRNGERMAGRTSFNDVAWPGYTFWRPGVLPVGQYVVRIVVEGEVFTQTFQVQEEGFISEI